VEQHGVHAVVEGVKGPLSATIMLRCVGACETKNHAVCSQERSNCDVVKFLVIVNLDARDGAIKLGKNKGMERDQGGHHIRLVAQGESPCKMSKNIQDNKIEFIA
jgi:hypothetical protein